MTDRVIAVTEAPFHTQADGINIGQLEGEILVATGFAPTAINSDSANITISFTQSSPPTVATLLPIVQAHDGRPKGQSRRVRADGAQVVASAVASYDAAPTHNSLKFVSNPPAITSSKTHVFAADCRLRGGRVWVSSGAMFGDEIKVELLNADDSVFHTPVPGFGIPNGGTGNAFVKLDSGQAIPISAGQKLKFTYTPDDTDGSSVQIIAGWLEIDGHE